MPWRKACILRGRAGNRVDSQEKRIQKKATNANCIKVRVAGFGKAFKMDLEDVFVRALEVYHTIQRIYRKHQHGN
jgi:mRNA-degrading endonuclease RelE of RelBE toxin-antitoxin system